MAWTDKPIQLDTFAYEYYLTDYAELLVDSNSNWAFEQVRDTSFNNLFTPLSEYKGWNRKGLLPDNTYWIRLKLRNSIPRFHIKDWRLYLGRADSIDVYLPGDDGSPGYQKFVAGDWYSSKLKKIPRPAHLARVPISLEEGQEVTVYIHYRSAREFPVVPELVLRRQEVFATWDNNITMRREGVLLGFILTMILMSLVMGIGTKDIAFYFHALFLMGVAGFILDINKLLHNLIFIRDWPWIKNYMVYLSVTLLDVGYILFVRQFVNLKDLYPKWDLVFRKFIGYRAIALVVISAFYFVSQDEPLSDALMGATFFIEYLFFIIPFLWILYRAGETVNRYLVYGTLVIVFDVLVNISCILLFINPPILLTHIGIIAEITFFTYGLGYRFFSMRRQQIEAGKMEELNELKSQFFTEVTHEFRTPIAVIKGMAEQISRNLERLPEQVQIQSSLSYINHYSDRLLNLVNQLLDLSRIEAGFEKYNPQLGDMHQFLRVMVAALKPLADSRNITLTFQGIEYSLLMDMDTDKLQKVITNLVSNACKFSPGGSTVSLGGYLVPDELGEKQFVLEVKDEGSGIPEEALPHIFDRYYQVDAEKQSEEFGTGVGLALVKELVKLMNGKIKLVSRPGKGSTFSIFLPVTREATEKTNGISEFSQPGLGSHPEPITADTPEKEMAGANTLLIVEDNPGMVEVLRQPLQKFYRVLVARNGREGIEKAIEVVPDLIISDLMMPEADGIQLIKEVRSHVASNHIPILLLTAKVEDKARLQALKAGALDYLNKPVNLKELFLKIENILQLQSSMFTRLQENKDDIVLVSPESEGGEMLRIQQAFMFSVKEAISNGFANEEFNVERLARELSLSRSQLSRKVSRVFGEPPSRLIHKKRIEVASQLLEKSDLSIGEIASRVGFADHSYFTKVFSGEQGISPSDFRERQRQIRDN